MKPRTAAGSAIGTALAILIAATAAANASGLSDEIGLELPTGLVVVHALESARNGQPCKEPDPAGEPCWYDYFVYRWQPAGGFHLLLSMESSEAIDTVNRPLAYDLALITDRLAEVDAKEDVLREQRSDTLYDRGQWIAISDTSMDLGSGLPRVRVVVLLSRASTGWSGYLEALHDVQLLLLDGDTVLYRGSQPHEFNAPEPLYFSSNYVHLRDVTGDGIPEVLYSTGFPYVTGTLTKEHVLRRRSRAASEFRDIAPDNFVDVNPDAPFRWIERDGETLAVKATPVPPDKPVAGCHFCDKRFIYDIFRWDPARESFARVVRVEGSEEREMDGQQIQADMPLIERALQSHASNSTGPKRRVVSSPAPDPQPPTP